MAVLIDLVYESEGKRPLARDQPVGRKIILTLTVKKQGVMIYAGSFCLKIQAIGALLSTR
jgi:hypothetical protein